MDKCPLYKDLHNETDICRRQTALTRIDDRIRRVDAVEKARGEAVYLCDVKMEGMLNARFVRSTIARGTIDSIEVPQLPDGYWFISARDIPEGGRNSLVMIAGDWRCFADGDVRYVGETIGILVGPSPAVLKALEKEIRITYTEREPAITIDDAIAIKGGPILEKDDVHCSLVSEKGEDVEDVLARADEIFEETIETGFQEHVHLETNAAICCIEDGKYTFYISCQCPFYVRKSVAGLLGLQPSDIRVKQTTTGGAFGGKEHFPDVLAGPLLVAESVIRKPIRLVFDREEDMLYSVKRHPSKIVFRTGLDKDGNLLGSDIDVYYNCGAYLSSSYVVLQRGVFHANGVYDFPSTRIHGYGMATNTFPSDAFRGFGAPQTLFAIETHLDHIAAKFGFDPVEYKRRYFLKQGDETVTQGPVVEKGVLDALLEQVARKSDYWRKAKEYARGGGRGIGMSFYNHGGAFTGNGEQSIIKAHLKLVKDGDRFTILCGQTEMGQGFRTILRKIVASVLEIDMDDVVYDNPDTDCVPDSGPTAASRSTMVVGRLAEEAAMQMKERLDEEHVEIETEYRHPDGHPWDQSTFKGDAYLGYGWGCACVEVEVDRLTNEVKVVGIWSSHDIGKAIDELIVHGQVNGGIIQSLGYASMEKMENRNGHFRQTSMSDYVVPTSMDFPRQEWGLVDNPYEWGPFGAKGMGELVFNGADAAYIDALERALDVTINRIPMPVEDIEGVRHD